MKVKLLKLFLIGFLSAILIPIAAVATLYVFVDRWYCWIINNMQEITADD